MKLAIHDTNVPIRFEDGGAVRVGPTRVTLEVLLGFYKQGMTAEQLVRSFPSLSIADVYAVLAYYHRYRLEMDTWLLIREKEGEVIRQQIESQPGYAEWRARLQDRIDAVRAGHVPAARG